jgi:inositol-phosphate phosphatase/L-galactose 1-phosphate phosphatase/histidinol-phosphatase
MTKDFKQFALHLADSSGDIIREYFRRPFAIDTKSDNSPVTEVDQRVEQVLRKAIMHTFPAHGIIGEEYPIHNLGAEYCWVIDPIDGTKAFMSGLPMFGTMVALVKEGIPILGMIDQPITGERWIAFDGKITLNGNTLKTRACSKLEIATISTTSPDYFNEITSVIFECIKSQCKTTLYGGDCYAYGQLAAGHIDIVMESGLKPHDFLALVPIVENAGGSMTDWQGNALTANSDGTVLALGDKVLLPQILELL